MTEIRAELGRAFISGLLKLMGIDRLVYRYSAGLRSSYKQGDIITSHWVDSAASKIEGLPPRHHPELP